MSFLDLRICGGLHGDGDRMAQDVEKFVDVAAKSDSASRVAWLEAKAPLVRVATGG